ncbi:MAG: ANTAR domain-containing protein [Candidatus Andersenbacteria bacterium]|nr:ANTAR domain-containing protein [Candidatus Andersenbacteria bacterium]
MSSGNGHKKVEVFIAMADLTILAWLKKELEKMPYVITGAFPTLKEVCDGLRALPKKPHLVITDFVEPAHLHAIQGIFGECNLPMVPFVLISTDSRGKLLRNDLPDFVLGRCLFPPMPAQLAMIILQAMQSCAAQTKLREENAALQQEIGEMRAINAAKVILMRRWPFFSEDKAHQYVVRVANQRGRTPFEQAQAFIRADEEFLIRGKDVKLFFP